MSNSTLTYTLYKHIFPNGKFYFGITSRPVLERWRKDGSGYKNNPSMWRAIKKYGWNNVKHEILFEGLTEAKANELEVKFINDYNTQDRRFGYNLRPGGRVASGWKHTEAAKQKMSKSQIGKCYQETPWNKGKHYGKTEIYQYDLEGNFIAKYSGYWEASQQIGIPLCGISDCANGACKTYYGFTFSKCLLPKEEVLQKVKSEQGTPKIVIYQYNQEGKLVNKYISYKEVMLATGICESNLSDCLNGRQKTSKGYVFSKIELNEAQVKALYDTKPRKSKYKITKIDRITGESIVYYSVRDLANDLQVKENVLRNVLNGAASKLNEKYLFIKEKNNEN